MKVSPDRHLKSGGRLRSPRLPACILNHILVACGGCVEHI